MDWSILTSAGPVGGLLGILGSGVTGWLSIKQKKAEAEIKAQLIKLEIDKSTIEGANQSFSDSQKAATEELKGLASVAPLADNRWTKGILVLLYAYRTSIRPNLTLLAHGLALWAFFQVSEEIQQQLAQSFFTMAFTYGGWWFGNQMMLRLFNGK